MASLLRDYGEIKASRYFEILVAATYDGELMAPNHPEFDVHCTRFGRVQVRTRVIGTDGKYPRISLRGMPSEFDVLIGAHLAQNFSINHAIALRSPAIEPLYLAKRQQDGKLAHIPWAQLVAAPGAEDVTKELSSILLP